MDDMEARIASLQFELASVHRLLIEFEESMRKVMGASVKLEEIKGAVQVAQATGITALLVVMNNTLMRAGIDSDAEVIQIAVARLLRATSGAEAAEDFLERIEDAKALDSILDDEETPKGGLN